MLIDRSRGHDLQVGWQARPGSTQIRGHETGEAGFKKCAGVERGLFENFPNLGFAKPAKLHPATRRG